MRVFNALKFAVDHKLPRLDLKRISMPIVAGSGNAYNTGRLLFADRPAFFGDENNFKKIIKTYQPLIAKKIIKHEPV